MPNQEPIKEEHMWGVSVTITTQNSFNHTPSAFSHHGRRKICRGAFLQISTVTWIIIPIYFYQVDHSNCIMTLLLIHIKLLKIKLRQYIDYNFVQDQEDISSCFSSNKISTCKFFLPRKFKLGGRHEKGSLESTINCFLSCCKLNKGI